MQDYTQVNAKVWHLICYDAKVRDAIIAKATRFAYIYHDKDILEDGISKPPHWHIYVYRRNQCKGEFFVKLGKQIAPKNGTVRVAVQNNGFEAIEYFQHLKDGEPIPNKTPYSLSAVVFDSKGNDDHFKSPEQRDTECAEAEQKKQDDNVAFINDLIVYKDNPFVLAKRYGKSYICNRRTFTEFATSLIDDENTPLEELSEEARLAIQRYRQPKPLPQPDLEFGLLLLGLESSEDTHKYAVLSNAPSDVRVRTYNTVMELRKQVSAFEIQIFNLYHISATEMSIYKKSCIDAYLGQTTPLDPNDFNKE